MSATAEKNIPSLLCKTGLFTLLSERKRKFSHNEIVRFSFLQAQHLFSKLLLSFDSAIFFDKNQLN